MEGKIYRLCKDNETASSAGSCGLSSTNVLVLTATCQTHDATNGITISIRFPCAVSMQSLAGQDLEGDLLTALNQAFRPSVPS
jgi:hypothetical protein